MSRSKAGGITARRKSALSLLEAGYKKFKAAGKDKAPWVTTRNGKEHHHRGRSYKEECARFEREIAILKEKLSKTTN